MVMTELHRAASRDVGAQDAGENDARGPRKRRPLALAAAVLAAPLALAFCAYLGWTGMSLVLLPLVYIAAGAGLTLVIAGVLWAFSAA
ncbi:hypothetical protein ROJ8625_02729 [Roseivivax jejudonensis]|uniref:Uncharacterized protein n=2 Tax=Roseivivax jejudonensis TaxID=1529041 RepID=A0A1X6ZK21_9RHOB|nr:hypothetical protein ROJ8625_02729 [Roseivivax jejudonensis]